MQHPFELAVQSSRRLVETIIFAWHCVCGSWYLAESFSRKMHARLLSKDEILLWANHTAGTAHPDVPKRFL